MSSAPVLLGCVLTCLTAGDQKPIELKPGAWINAPTVRVPDDRTYVLLFFTTFQERETRPFLVEVNKLRGRSDTVVIGLSAESKERVKKFVEKHKIRFAVGAASRAYKRFDIKKFPRVVILKQDADQTRTATTFAKPDWLASWFPQTHPLPRLKPGAFDDVSSVERLTRYALTCEDDDSDRKRALNILRSKLPAEEFMRLCDQILEDEFRPGPRGAVAYQKHLADPGAPDKEPLYAPSVRARQHMQASADDPKWDRVHDYYLRIDERPSEQLVEDFSDPLTEDPADLLIRKGIPTAMEKRPDREFVRQSLMRMLPDEPDFVVRARIVGAFLDVCTPGDFACADFLDEQRKTETNIRAVRPMMEYTIRYLRTGEE